MKENIPVYTIPGNAAAKAEVIQWVSSSRMTKKRGRLAFDIQKNQR